MRIPITVPLLGHRITVTIIPAADWPHGETVGMWEPAKNAISLHADLSRTALEQTYLHELTHAALDQMAHRLSKNEAFVDQFASLLHQALTGARYARKPRSPIAPPDHS